MPPRRAPLEDPLPVRPRGALDVVLHPPGSRSLTNRALLAAALASGESLLSGVTPSDDTRAMRDGLRALGVRIEKVEAAATRANNADPDARARVQPGANARVHGNDARADAAASTGERARAGATASADERARADAAASTGERARAGATASADERARADAAASAGAHADPGVAARATETWRVFGSSGALRAPARGEVLNAGASGTTARFLAAAATLASGATTLDGSERMRARPIAELADALTQLGAPARVLGANGCPPLALAGGGLQGGRARVSAARSSQFVSALLLAAPCAARDVEIELRERALVSRPFVDMTLAVMRAFGAAPEWREDARALAVPARGYRSARYEVAPDAQAAVYGFCAAAICGGRVRVPGLATDRVQGDLGVLDALEQMGCRVAREGGQLEVRGPEGALRGIRVDGNAWPDAVLALAVVALFADGPSTLTGIAHLRLKESDRIAALSQELTRLGARVRAEADALHITPGAPPPGAVIQTYDDHRMAMSFALAGLRIPGVKICDPGCAGKTWPGFFDVLESW